MFLDILNNFIAIYVPTCICRKRVPWSVDPPSALRAARAAAWSHYKNLQARFGRHSEVVEEALGVFNIAVHPSHFILTLKIRRKVGCQLVPSKSLLDSLFVILVRLPIT